MSPRERSARLHALWTPFRLYLGFCKSEGRGSEFGKAEERWKDVSSIQSAGSQWGGCRGQVCVAAVEGSDEGVGSDEGG